MSSASPGEERCARAIRFRRRRSASEATRSPGESRDGQGEVEEEVDAQPRFRIQEVRADRSVQTKPGGGHAAAVDRGRHISRGVDPGSELEAAVVEGVEKAPEGVAGTGDDEVEVPGDPARSKHHQGHAPHENRLQAEVRERLDHAADALEMGWVVFHVTIGPDRGPAGAR
jgi:hypothetical protein